MIVEDLPLRGLKLIKPRIFEDDRGSFVETDREDLPLRDPELDAAADQ